MTRRPKYAFRGSDGVVQALAPAHIIEGGLPTERLLAYIAVYKYADAFRFTGRRRAICAMASRSAGR